MPGRTADSEYTTWATGWPIGQVACTAGLGRAPMIRSRVLSGPCACGTRRLARCLMGAHGQEMLTDDPRTKRPHINPARSLRAARASCEARLSAATSTVTPVARPTAPPTPRQWRRPRPDPAHEHDPDHDPCPTPVYGTGCAHDHGHNSAHEHDDAHHRTHGHAHRPTTAPPTAPAPTAVPHRDRPHAITRPKSALNGNDARPGCSQA
jgi:hypothetical protein